MTNVDEVLQLHSELLNDCMRDCMLTRPELLRTVGRLLAVCVSFVDFLQVGHAAPDDRTVCTVCVCVCIAATQTLRCGVCSAAKCGLRGDSD